MSTALGLALVVIGALGIAVGGWSAISERRPPWLSDRAIPWGRERTWGLAMAILGLGACALGLFWVYGLLFGIAGALLMFLGVGFLVRAVAPTSARR